MAVKRKKKSRKPASIALAIGGAGFLGGLGVIGGIWADAAIRSGMRDHENKNRAKLHEKTLSSIQKRRTADIKRLEAKGDKKSKKRAARIKRNRYNTDKKEDYEKRRHIIRQSKTYFDP